MNLSLESEAENVVCVRASGKLTQRNISPFEEPMVSLLGPDAYAKQVLLNMQDVELLDSSGVSWLLVCHKQFRESGGDLVLHTVSQIANNTLKVLNLTKVFQLAEDEKSAREMMPEKNDTPVGSDDNGPSDVDEQPSAEEGT